jgi:phage tail sheath protein FI
MRTAADEFSIRGNTIVNLLIGYDNGLNSGYLDDMSEIAKESGMSLAVISYDSGDLAGMKATNIRTGIIDGLGNKRTDTTSGALTSFNDYTYVVATSKLMYDKYNDKDRWMSVAGDVAGYMAANDSVNGSWFPVAGIDRGIVSNYKRLLWSPSSVDQNELSRNGLNSIVKDKELGYAYIFEYITNTTENKMTAEANIRRLLITLKDYLRTTLKGSFFSFNDAIERNAVLYKITDTFLNIKNRRGLYDFRLICDDTNNTSDVINQNQFVVDVMIQPTRMIKFIKVNFLIFDSGFNLQEFEI